MKLIFHEEYARIAPYKVLWSAERIIFVVLSSHLPETNLLDARVINSNSNNNNNKIYYMSAIVLNISYVSIKFSQQCCEIEHYYDPYFTDEETKAQKSRSNSHAATQIAKVYPLNLGWLRGTFCLEKPK